MPAAGRSAATLPMLTIRPPLSCSCMTALAAWATKNGASRFSRTTAVTRLGDAVAAGAGGEPPALLTTMSSRPSRFTASPITALACSGSRTSAVANSIPGSALAGRDLAQASTRAPWSRNSVAMASPMPRLPPVTRTARPARVPSVGCGRSEVMPNYRSGCGSRGRPLGQHRAVRRLSEGRGLRRRTAAPASSQQRGTPGAGSPPVLSSRRPRSRPAGRRCGTRSHPGTPSCP